MDIIILTDLTIKENLKENILSIDPIEEIQIQPASVDLRLGDHFLVINHSIEEPLNLLEPISYKSTYSDSFVIPSHGFVLATTKEFIRLPEKLTAFVEGRSSVGRAGLFIQNAGWVDPGFHGKITLELYNANPFPITLEVGIRICQLVLVKTDKSPSKSYSGKYQSQATALGSKIHLDTDR